MLKHVRINGESYLSLEFLNNFGRTEVHVLPLDFSPSTVSLVLEGKLQTNVLREFYYRKIRTWKRPPIRWRLLPDEMKKIWRARYERFNKKWGQGMEKIIVLVQGKTGKYKYYKGIPDQHKKESWPGYSWFGSYNTLTQARASVKIHEHFPRPSF